jgi:hypothetical protein
VKALSLKPPWPWVILNGFKPVENRSWTTKYRGPLLIHQSKTFDWAGWNFIQKRHRLPLDCAKDKGCLVGRVDLVDVVREHPSPWAFGPYVWVLRNPEKFSKPIPWRGQLGLFDVPDDVLTK